MCPKKEISVPNRQGQGRPLGVAWGVATRPAVRGLLTVLACLVCTRRPHTCSAAKVRPVAVGECACMRRWRLHNRMHFFSRCIMGVFSLQWLVYVRAQNGTVRERDATSHSAMMCHRCRLCTRRIWHWMRVGWRWCPSCRISVERRWKSWPESEDGDSRWRLSSLLSWCRLSGQEIRDNAVHGHGHVSMCVYVRV